MGDKRSVGFALNALGHIACMQGDYPTARSLHAHSLAVQREIGNMTGIAWSLNNLGLVSYIKGLPRSPLLHEQSLLFRGKSATWRHRLVLGNLRDLFSKGLYHG